MKTYGLAIIGFGGIGHYHSEQIPYTKQLKLIGVYDIKEERHELARSKGIHTYESYQDTLNDKNVDIVLISTPNDSHESLTIAALEHGKHVICEKPVTIDTNAYLRMVETSKKMQKLFIVHQSRRWDEDYLTAKKLIESKEIGHVFHIESRVHGGNGIPGDWRCERRYGGGMLYDWGVHLIDQMCLINQMPIVDMKVFFSHVLGYDVDDGFKLYLTFKDGMTALVEVETTNFIKLPRWYIKGTHGTAVIEDFQANGHMEKLMVDLKDTILKPVKAGNGFTKTMAPPKEDALMRKELPKVEVIPYAFYDHVTSCLDQKETQTIKHEEVHKVLKIIEDALKMHDLEYNKV